MNEGGYMKKEYALYTSKANGSEQVINPNGYPFVLGQYGYVQATAHALTFFQHQNQKLFIRHKKNIHLS